MSGFGGYGAAPPPGGGVPPSNPYGTPDLGTGGAPTCPRHPDRVSYTRCQRCGRPACAQCQRPAAVGFHCVDCANLAAAARPATRTVFGGVHRGGTPVVTITIIGICVAIELLRWVAPSLWTQVAGYLIFVPSWGLTEPYRFLTSTLLHSGIWHIAFNMYALWLIGSQLEVALGRLRFLSLYVLSALGGSVAYLAIAGLDAPGAVGASGGVFGLFGAFAVLMRRLGRDPKPVLMIIAINVVLGFVISNIAWQAHLGGLVVGSVVAVIFARVPLRRSVPRPLGPGGSAGSGGSAVRSGAALQWLLCGAVLAVLVAVVAVVYAVG